MLMNMMNDNESTTFELDTGHSLHVTCMTTTRDISISSTDIFSIHLCVNVEMSLCLVHSVSALSLLSCRCCL